MRPGCDQDAMRMRSGCDPDAIGMRSGCEQDAIRMRSEMRRCRYDEERRRERLADDAGAPRGLSIDGRGAGIDDDYDR